MSKLPTVPTYQGASADSTAANAAQATANDIWDLGKLYDQPVFLGYMPLYQRQALSEYGVQPAETPQHNVTGQTQDIMQQAMKSWSEQATERKKNPDQLTQFEQLQQQLWYGGFYGQTPLDSVHVGQWTSQTEDALKGALQSYEQAYQSATPVTFSDFLKENASAAQSGVGGENSSAGNGGAGSGSGGGSTSTAPIALTDPSELRAAAQSAATAALSHSLSDKQLDLFVQQFQAQQMANATQQGGTVTSQDVGTQAMQFAQQENPGAYQAHNAQSYMNALVNMLSGGSVRPTMTPVPEA